MGGETLEKTLGIGVKKITKEKVVRWILYTGEWQLVERESSKLEVAAKGEKC